MQAGTGKKINFLEAAAIGIGGMVGGGIFAVLGLSVQLASGGAPVAFAIAGLVALLTAYSYMKLSVAFPSQGGTVTFLDRAFGPGLAVGGLNVLLWLSYIVMLSLYSFAFGSYGAAFASPGLQPLLKHILISFSIVAITGLNLLSADVIGKAEGWIVGLKLAILLMFVAVGVFGIAGARIGVSTWAPPLGLIAGGMIIFLAYEGFELIANASEDVRNAKRDIPRAFMTSVLFVIALYILVALVTVGNLPVSNIVGAKDYALAEAARPFLGSAGFWLIAIAALLSTASAINATLYGASRLSYTIARDGELPALLEKKVWNEPLEGLLITAGVTLVVANLFDLSSISVMGSAGFLIIFAVVNAANVKLARDTKSKWWLSLLALLACLAALVALLWQTYLTSPSRIFVLIVLIVLAFVIEGGYRVFRKRSLHLRKPTRKTPAQDA